MITVTFLNGCILATAEQSLWQYSYNQQLQINGLELPGVFTVDFCNEGDTTTVAMIGSSGVVDIPNELLTSGRDIVAYVFQKSTLTGGITRCEIRIDVLTRPERDDETPTPEQEAVIDQYIAELNEGVETAETAAANAETSENNAAASAADAQQSKADAAASASAAAGSASDASNSAAAAAQSAVNASNSAEDAAEAASEGIGYKEDSEAWAIGKRGGVDVGSSDETYHNNSKYYAGQAAASSSAANSEAAAAAQSARDAAASANGAAQSAASATASKNAAANSADIAANAATAAQNHAISAASSATAAGGSATAAANKATAAAQSATAAGNSATEAATAREAAEDAQDAAEAAAQSIAQSAAQIAQNTSDIADLKDAVDTLQPAATAADIGKALIVKTVADGKPTEYEYGEAGGGGDATNYAPIIINSASGDIASFTDGADGLPIKALSVNVEPIQDLHGYDSPWPAGGGKNLLHVNRTTSEINGITITINKDSAGNLLYINVNGTSTGAVNFNLCGESVSYVLPLSAGSYIVTSQTTDNNVKLRVGNSNNQYMGQATTGAYNLTADGNGNTFQINIDSGKTINNVKIYPMIRLASVTDATYASYSNICPISGRTSATVTRTGKNLANMFNDGKVPSITNGQLVTANGFRSDFIPFKANSIFTFHVTGAVVYLMCYDKDKNFLTAFSDDTGTIFKTTPQNTAYVMLRKDNNTAPADAQLEYGAATAYDPYAGNTYTIQLGDTVYGGTLDVTGGKMVVDRGIYIPTGNESNYTQQAGRVAFALLNDFRVPGTVERICSDFKILTASTYCYVYTTLTPDELKTYFQQNTVQMVLGLATPIEITLTPTQIDTLLGENNIWSDAGDVSVDYRADTKLYIDNIHTPTDDDMTADAQIASGKYFIVGGNLYKSTTVIPAGDTIIPGTNCVQTNLAEALNALNA